MGFLADLFDSAQVRKTKKIYSEAKASRRERTPATSAVALAGRGVPYGRGSRGVGDL
jgi:hypothetical protein